jgi:hypothetical protein
MSFGLPLMLFGLAGVAIPLLIHLFNRRRYETVAWGAMQFLQFSQTRRRRLFIEELLLLLLRMGLIALLVMALAAPYSDNPVLADLTPQSNRDLVLVFDGSASMGYEGGTQTAHEAAKEWALALVDKLVVNDSVAVLQAKQQVVPILDELSHDRERVRQAIEHLPEPAGGCDWPAAVREADKILTESTRPQRDIILLTDGQRVGWADESTLVRWELLARTREGLKIPPRIWVVNLAPNRPANPPNWSLAPLHASRAIASAGQQITFRTALQFRGQNEYRAPYRFHLEIDGRPVTDLPPPAAAGLEKGQVPLSFSQRFATPGSHLVSVIVEPDPPAGQRPAGYEVKDLLPGDNRQDLAIEVLPALPVLLVDGDGRPTVRQRGTDFLRDALSPARDPAPVVRAKVVSLREFTPESLTQDLGTEPGTRPRVLVLANVPRLSSSQQEAVTQFLAQGGGVLVTLGERVDPRHYNEQLYADGQGWLPARLDEPVGDESKPESAPNPLPASFFHPALELFREAPLGGLSEARFPRWWKVSTAGRQATAVPVGLLTNNDPFLLERSYRGGRVLLCTVPLDNSWRTNLPELPAFAPLVHELIYYLAGARTAENNIQPGQPLRYPLERGETLNMLSLQPPNGPARPLAAERDRAGESYQARVVRQAQGAQVIYENTRETGVYRLTNGEGRICYYVGQPDPRESDLTPSSEAERQQVAQLLPMTYEVDPRKLIAPQGDANTHQELWWALLLGVVIVLLSEVWLTRRIAKDQ